jgi:hypothetical protein
LEMLACGRRVIATNYSAHTEYCHAENALLIDISRLIPAHDGRWNFGKGGHWAAWDDAQADQLCHHLRRAYELHRQGDTVNHAGIETGRRFTWDHTADLISQAAFG